MSATEVSSPSVVDFVADARAWLAQRLEPARVDSDVWGEGSDDVSVFHRLPLAEEWDLLRRAMAWQQIKFDAGYGAIAWPREFGGAGLSAAHERAYSAVEAEFVTPPSHETFGVTTGLVAPTVRLFAQSTQRARFVRRFLRAEQLCCQLFSEPRAGSDLAGLGTRAVRDGDEWVINGQKIWSSGHSSPPGEN